MAMQFRQVGKTKIRLSVIGFGTAQLQMLSRRQAVETLVQGFKLGVNWVHAAPEYGGIEPWIKAAIERSGKNVMVLSSGPPRTRDMAPFFENTCHIFGTQSLALYGISGIEDIEWHAENVWEKGGMLEYLEDMKARGRLGGIYCSTHGPAEYAAKLVKSKVFDAVMLAWNPLGFHQQSHSFARAKAGRGYEDLNEYRETVFPLAEENGVSLLIMKPFAGGMLCKSRALEPHDWFTGSVKRIKPPDVLRLILRQPAVCAVLPGTSCVEEARENALAGHGPIQLALNREKSILEAADKMHTVLCSRCGRCEPTCSRGLPIPAMFRDAYIWILRNETVMANPTENYFDLHSDRVLVCKTCKDRTCQCIQSIDIPEALQRIHEQMQRLLKIDQHPGPSVAFSKKTINANHDIHILTKHVSSQLTGGQTTTARFLVRNVGNQRWMAPQHVTDGAQIAGIGVMIDNRLETAIPLRNTVCPGEVSPIIFEFRAPSRPGNYLLQFCLIFLADKSLANGTIFFSNTVEVTSKTPLLKWKSAVTGLVQRLIIGDPQKNEADSKTQAAGAVNSARAMNKTRRYDVRYIEHTIPDKLKARVTYGVRLTLENTGAMVWEARPSDSGPVQAHVFVDNVLLAVLPLPQARVATGEKVHFHFPFRAHDDPGPHRVAVALVQKGVGQFSDHGVLPWQIPVTVVPSPMTVSTRLHEVGRKHNPWYYNPLAGIQKSRAGHPFPLFITRAKGCHVWDAEGNRYLDYTMGWGSTILGHADDRIQSAIRRMTDTGAVLPFPHPVEMEVSEMLIRQFPSNDMVVFGKNGSDVCTIASRLARVVTQKKVILSCGFHGWQDFALAYFRFEECGIPNHSQPYLYKFGFNDRQGFLKLYNRYKDDLAAIMIEPAGPLIDEEEGLAGEPDPQFLQLLKESAHQAKALLIFDEIITGFRYQKGSVQKALGIIPDLTCLGKALASGMPLSALVGPYRIFLEYFHKAHFNATFKGEIYSLAAARKAIEIYRSEPVARHIWQYGEKLGRAIHGICGQLKIKGRCTGPPFRMLFVFEEADVEKRRLKKTLLMQELLKSAIVTVNGMMLPTAAHIDDTLSQTIGAFSKGLEKVAFADQKDRLHQYIELPLLTS
jgi:glutamate-1-semialdehyde aminotransferase/predicted aldo/keto reductase-like oxidoreductase